MLKDWIGNLYSDHKGRTEAKFYEEHEAAFGFLVEEGFEIRDRNYAHESFGNGQLRYEREGVVVEVTRDRGQHRVDFFVSTMPGEAFPHWLLRRYLERPLPADAPDLGAPWRAVVVREDLDEVVALLTSDSVEALAQALRDDYKAWFSKKFGTSRS